MLLVEVRVTFTISKGGSMMRWKKKRVEKDTFGYPFFAS